MSGFIVLNGKRFDLPLGTRAEFSDAVFRAYRAVHFIPDDLAEDLRGKYCPCCNRPIDLLELERAAHPLITVEVPHGYLCRNAGDTIPCPNVVEVPLRDAKDGG